MSEPLPSKACAFCGDLFTPKLPLQKYDTADCRYRQARQVAYERKQAERAAIAAREAVRALQPTK